MLYYYIIWEPFVPLSSQPHVHLTNPVKTLLSTLKNLSHKDFLWLILNFFSVISLKTPKPKKSYLSQVEDFLSFGIVFLRCEDCFLQTTRKSTAKTTTTTKYAAYRKKYVLYFIVKQSKAINILQISRMCWNFTKKKTLGSRTETSEANTKQLNPKSGRHQTSDFRPRPEHVP